jgi:hypothetical protein
VIDIQNDLWRGDLPESPRPGGVDGDTMGPVFVQSGSSGWVSGTNGSADVGVC